MKDYDAIAREIYRDEAISRMLYYDQQEDQCVELIAAIIRKHDEAEAGGAHCGCCGKWMPNGSEEWDLCDACAKPAPTDEKALRKALKEIYKWCTGEKQVDDGEGADEALDRIAIITRTALRDREAPKTFDEAIALLDAEEPSVWISVEDRLPEYDKGVIAYVKSGSVLEMKYASNKNHPRLVPRWEWMGRSVPFWEITHWMPLPSPPDVRDTP
jgi:hypothetical protein